MDTETDRWSAVAEPVDAQRDPSPPQPPRLLSPAGLQTALLAQLTAQHASQLQYQQALLAWARLVSSGLAERTSTAERSAASTGGDVASSTASSSPPQPSKANRRLASRPRLFACYLCGRCFGYKHVLQNHLRTHTGEKPFQCSECLKRFTRDHHLKTHMRLHTGERPYQCVHCNRRFVQVANLRRHLRVHTGERPYACRLCTARFSDSNQLKNHEQVHTGQKPFRCTVCGAEFRRRTRLVQHKCGGPRAGPGPAGGEGALRHGQGPSETRIPVRPAEGLGVAEDLTTLKLEPEPKMKLEDDSAIDQSVWLETGLRSELATADSSQTEPQDLSVSSSRWTLSSNYPENQRHPSVEDFSVSSSQWTASTFSSYPLDKRLDSAPLRSPTVITSELSSRLKWPSSSARQRHDDGENRESKGHISSGSVTWWDRQGTHSSRTESGDILRTSSSFQKVPETAWPLHPRQQQHHKVMVFPENQQRSSDRAWDQLARAGPHQSGAVRDLLNRSGIVRHRVDWSQTVKNSADLSRAVRNPMDRPAAVRDPQNWFSGLSRTRTDGEENPGRRGEKVQRPVADRCWPWNLSLANAGRHLPETRVVNGLHTDSTSPGHISLADVPSSASPGHISLVEISSSSEDERREKSPSVASQSHPNRCRVPAESGRGKASHGQRAPPPLLPLWIPPMDPDPPRRREDGGRTTAEDNRRTAAEDSRRTTTDSRRTTTEDSRRTAAEDRGRTTAEEGEGTAAVDSNSALLQLLTAPCSPLQTELPRGQRPVSQSPQKHTRDAEHPGSATESHTQVYCGVTGVEAGNWNRHDGKHLWRNMDEKYYRKDSADAHAQRWAGVRA